MASTIPFRCTNDPKDFSLWDAHKDTFRRLFLTETKSLAEVKKTMEESGFPETNVKTYEVVLREHFKFRKNLEAGQWLLVGQELDKWKSQGLDCVVSLSGISQDPKLVDRKIRRERAEAARGKLKYSKSQRFPDAVTIISKVNSTPEVSGSTPQNTIGHLESLFALAQRPEPPSANLSALMSLSDPLLSQQQLSNDAQVVGLQADFVEYILHNPIGEVYRTLRENVPSRQFVCFLRSLWESDRLSPNVRSILASTLFGFINMMRNMPPIENQRLPEPRILGPNDSITLLATICKSYCNGRNVQANLLLHRTLRKWLATVADIGVLQQFFSIPLPAMATIWSNLTQSFKRAGNAYLILIEVALRVHRGKWLHRNRGETLGRIISNGSQSTANCFLDWWKVSLDLGQSLEHSTLWHDIAFQIPIHSSTEHAPVQILIDLSAKFHAPQEILDIILAELFWQLPSSQAAAVRWLVEEGVKIQPEISDWIPSCAQQLPPDWKLAWVPEPLIPADLGEVFRGNQSPRPSCRNIFGTFLPLLGILASARSGRDDLRRFMGTLSIFDPSEREQLLRLALYQTTLKRDIETTNLLLETGMFLNMEPFRRHRWDTDFQRCSDPVLHSAVKSDNKMLHLLLSHRLFENYHASDILLEMRLLCYSPGRRHEWQPTVDFLLEREGPSLKYIWDEVSNSVFPSGLDLIRDYVERRISRQRTPYLEIRDLLCTIFPEDTLRETIKHGFGIDVVESLVTAGISLSSDPSGNENTLLIDALLTPAKDRYKIVHFLLRNGSDPSMSGSNCTVLEATLSIRRERVRDWDPLTDENKLALDLFRELSELGAPFKREMPPMTLPPLPLVGMLIERKANVSLLQQAVSAGAQINELGTEPPWSVLNIAALSGQLDTVKWLLKKGADINARARPELVTPDIFSGNNTALEYAIKMGDMDMVILLLSHGAIINSSFECAWGDLGYRRSCSTVDWAAIHGRLDILKVLVDSGGLSAYPGVSGLDGTFWEADDFNQPGITMFLEQYTGLSSESIIESMKVRLESMELW